MSDKNPTPIYSWIYSLCTIAISRGGPDLAMVVVFAGLQDRGLVGLDMLSFTLYRGLQKAESLHVKRYILI